MSLSKAKFPFGDSQGFPFRETLSEAKSRLLINFPLPSFLPGHLQYVHRIFFVYSALVDVNWQDNRRDTKSDVTAVLLGGLICQWHMTFRSMLLNTPDNLLFHHWTPLDVFQLHRTDTRWTKFQYFLHSRAGMSINLRAEFPHREFKKM